MQLLRETCLGPLGSHAARGLFWGQASRGAAPAGRLWWAPAELCMQRWTPCSAVPLGMFDSIFAVQSSTEDVCQHLLQQACSAVCSAGFTNPFCHILYTCLVWNLRRAAYHWVYH